MHTITLSDGTKLKNLELNGNNYIAPTIIEDSVFEGNLGMVTISDGECTETHTDMVLIQNQVVDGESWFILEDKTAQQRAGELAAQELTDMQQALAEVYELITGGM